MKQNYALQPDYVHLCHIPVQRLTIYAADSSYQRHPTSWDVYTHINPNHCKLRSRPGPTCPAVLKRRFHVDNAFRWRGQSRRASYMCEEVTAPTRLTPAGARCSRQSPPPGEKTENRPTHEVAKLPLARASAEEGLLQSS